MTKQSDLVTLSLPPQVWTTICGTLCRVKEGGYDFTPTEIAAVLMFSTTLFSEITDMAFDQQQGKSND